MRAPPAAPRDTSGGGEIRRVLSSRRVQLRAQDVDVDSVVVTHLVDQAIGLWVQSARIEREYGKVVTEACRHVNQNYVLCAAERNGNLVMGCQRTAQGFHRIDYWLRRRVHSRAD